MAGGADDQWGVDGVGVHAGMIVVVEGHERPVGHDTCDADTLCVTCNRGRAGDQVLDASSVEELDVWEGEDLGEQGGGEECRVLDHDHIGVGGLFLVWNAKVIEEAVRRLAEDHGGEQLATEPCTTA